MLRFTLTLTLLATVLGFSPISSPFKQHTPLSTSGLPKTLGAIGGVGLASTASVMATAPPETATHAMVVATDTLGVMVFAVAVVWAYLRNSEQALADEKEDWACLLPYEQEEPACGRVSFDSSDDMVCVESYQEGKLRWVCA
jgi:hypothetical protein